jgi:hypothetical protein
MQQLAPSPSQPESRPIPYGLVSLWDMINFSVALYVDQLRILEMMEARVRKPPALNALALASVQEDGGLSEIFHAARRSVEATKRILIPLDSHVLRTQIEWLEMSLNYAGMHNLEDIANKLATLIRTIETELHDHRFYHYPRDKGRLLERTSSDWATVIAAFPKAEEDIKAAVDCYALGHNHASIYHSMMVLEHGLPALARRLRVPVKKDRASWGGIIKDIREEIDRRHHALFQTPKGQTPPTAKVAKATKKLLDPCRQAAIEFSYFTENWRNHIAHVRATYDENDAKKVLEHVRSFMEVIATKLRLKGGAA